MIYYKKKELNSKIDLLWIESVIVHYKTGLFYKCFYNGKTIYLKEFAKLIGMPNLRFNTREFCIENNIKFSEIDLT
jgi:hypothetical protein